LEPLLPKATFNGSYIGEDISGKLEDNLVNQLRYQDMEFLQNIRNGELISRIVSDIDKNKTVN